jgi:hypothetical protein
MSVSTRGAIDFEAPLPRCPHLVGIIGMADSPAAIPTLRQGLHLPLAPTAPTARERAGPPISRSETE